TRQQIKELFNAPDERNVIFTANVTTSLNMVLKGLLKPGDHVLTSSMEHNAVMRPLTALKEKGIISFDRVPCDACGFTDAMSLEKFIMPNTRAVVMTHASNINGAVQPVADIGRLCRERDILFIVDAAQTAGVLDIDMEEMCIDVLCFTGHKGLMGPQGTGGFCIGKRAEGLIDTVLEGGTGSASHLETMPDILPDRYEPGTLNLPGIYGLSAGLDFIAKTGTKSIRERERALCERFIKGIKDIPGVGFVGRHTDDQVCNGVGVDAKDSNKYVAVVSLVFDGIDAARAAYELEDEFGIMTRVGLHCAPAAHKSLGTFPEGTVRFSFGYFNTEEEIDHGIEAIGKLCERRG
ncbi:MAG: aminotransferase class V-fold PLP-dependent enzyme, partial [Lachnospiraceae bacterium]|nr:aminotransferase class V-fold PLP-dependent enzyme [Lachnospiraceae bacterium]